MFLPFFTSVCHFMMKNAPSNKLIESEWLSLVFTILVSKNCLGRDASMRVNAKHRLSSFLRLICMCAPPKFPLPPKILCGHHNHIRESSSDLSFGVLFNFNSRKKASIVCVLLCVRTMDHDLNGSKSMKKSEKCELWPWNDILICI